MMISQTETQNTSQKDRTFLESSNDIKILKNSKSRKKLNFNKKIHEHPKYSSYSSSSVATSFVKKSIADGQTLFLKNPIQTGYINYFIEKYLPRGNNIDDLESQMNRIIQRKDCQMETLRVYRDELKFISFNNPYSSPIKLNLRSLKEKAKIQNKMNEQKLQLTKDIKIVNEETYLLQDYLALMMESLQNVDFNHDIIDIQEEQNMMVRNLQSATQMLVKELAEEKRRNTREVRAIQEEILDLRIIIKQKQDKLRDLKAKICTMYIKLHSRNRGHANSKTRNLSLSVRKFNKQNFERMEEIFVGNSTFKKYSRQINEKVSQSQQLRKVKVFTYKNQLTFQCVYDKMGEGTIHSQNTHLQSESISQAEDYQNPQSMKMTQFESENILQGKNSRDVVQAKVRKRQQTCPNRQLFIEFVTLISNLSEQKNGYDSIILVRQINDRNQYMEPHQTTIKIIKISKDSK